MTPTIIALTIAFFCFAISLVALVHGWNASQKEKLARKGKHPDQIKRHIANPVISPNDWNAWETVGTFNPAAIKDKDGNIHLLYRAIGADGASRVGYASSSDGLNFDDRLSYPVFVMQNPRRNVPHALQKVDPVMYPSGGSWGGVEDPRMVEIDGKIYMTFNAFDGWDFIRIGVTWIKSEDFFAKKWKWSRPLLISPAGEINKNWVLFPEKIDGKFAVLHSITPDVQIDFVNRLEDLDYGTRSIRSKFQHKAPRETWDTWVRGAGPPPVKTDRGWLVLYHAMDKADPAIGYKLGAMLLDLQDPRRIIARSPGPILTPSEWYENDWKPGVVYATGAVVKDDTLYVYYGGGDKHVSVAHTRLHALLDWLIKNGSVNK